jgi:hypothetical protein
MLDLFKQFFSFNKLMKDRLVTAFFYLGLVVIALMFLSTIRIAFAMFGHSFSAGLGLLVAAIFQILFSFIGLRLLCELMIAVFHINNNLSPDGGKSETADIDVIETTRKAASKAAHQASNATKSMVDKTKTKLAERGEHGDDHADYDDPTPPKPAAKKSTAKKPAAKKPAVKKAAPKKTVAKKAPAKKPAAKKPVKRKTPAKK